MPHPLTHLPANMQHFSPFPVPPQTENIVSFKQAFYGTDEPAELILRISTTETETVAGVKGSGRKGYNVYIWADVKDGKREVVKIDGKSFFWLG
jgi:hypothetical protein